MNAYAFATTILTLFAVIGTVGCLGIWGLYALEEWMRSDELTSCMTPGCRHPWSHDDHGWRTCDEHTEAW